MKITKIGAAESQLKEAIRMLILNCDAVPIHTLACSAHQILYDLARKEGIASSLKDIVPNRKKRAWLNALNSSYNFFRHADKDADDEIEFDPRKSHFFILDGTHLFQQLTNKLFYEGALFRLWFNKEYLDYLATERPDTFQPNTIQISESYFTDDDFIDFLELIDKYHLDYVESRPATDHLL